MRTHLGWLTFLLALAFGACLVAALILNTWFGFPGERTVLGFFGFGVPTMITGGATAALWEGRKSLQNLLGWASTITGLVCGAAVLLLVADRVFSDVQSVIGPLIWRLAAFGIAGLVCGGFGIDLLVQAEANTRSG